MLGLLELSRLFGLPTSSLNNSLILLGLEVLALSLVELKVPCCDFAVGASPPNPTSPGVLTSMAFWNVLVPPVWPPPNNFAIKFFPALKAVCCPCLEI